MILTKTQHEASGEQCSWISKKPINWRTCCAYGFATPFYMAFFKTVRVKKLLENALETMQPPPQRIIWCYGQWQPLYFEILESIPGIEFYESVPDDIGKSSFLDVTQRNLIVLDDLMAQTGKDRRVADLFTKESHHRNLSVTGIVQNIFHQGKEMRNISFNAHY